MWNGGELICFCDKFAYKPLRIIHVSVDFFVGTHVIVEIVNVFLLVDKLDIRGRYVLLYP